ncbi:patatin-like phospholipase family protein [Taibaiella lutea]|nr:patatin-like phospholipase family protein [Taibaiella lutea]
MRERLQPFFRFLPVQLLLLHFRKYQMILIFWLMLFAAVTGNLATHFGAQSLFVSPEYMGAISPNSFFLLGGCIAIFAMSWHITTFIIHSKRVPFLGSTHHAFLKYCINNSIIPLSFLITYGIVTARYLMINEGAPTLTIIMNLFAFYMGYIIMLLLSFFYFFRADRNILKILLSNVANPSIIREIIPYDSLDNEFELVRADSYMTHIFRIEKIKTPYEYNRRFLNMVLRRHHRNAVFAIFIAIVLILLLGIFMDNPFLRIPAAAGFMILFSIMLCAVGAFKYYLQSWEIIGWICIFGLASYLAGHGLFDLRSIAFGMKYDYKAAPAYNYSNLKNTFTDSAYLKDKNTEIHRLELWKQKAGKDSSGSTSKPPLVIISVSGGGSRASYWTFRCLQYADSITHGQLFRHNVFITGASGGMIGAAYWRSVHTQAALGKIEQPYNPAYQQLVGKDLLNAVIFSLACVDIISPFNKITIAGKRFNKDRGYAFDKELASNSKGLLNYTLKDYKGYEASGLSPMLLINGTIINDARRILISPQPVSYLTRSVNSLGNPNPIIDAVDFAAFFKNQDPMDMQIMSALRMSATFPIVLPVVKLPSYPEMNVMDAGLRDNFGTESSMRYLCTFKDWMNENAGEIIFLQIRDTKANEPSENDVENSMASMLFDPMFAIQQKWSGFQTYHQSYLADYVGDAFPGGKLKKITLQYVPQDKDKSAALNFHLTGREKKDLMQSVFNVDNQKGFEALKDILNKEK